MTNTDKPLRPIRPVPYVMDEDQAQLLARLSADYADDLPQIRERAPHASITALLHAVHAHQAQRVFACDPRWRETAGITEVPEDRADDVAAALALLQVARDDLEGLEAALLLGARTASTRTGKPLLTFKQIAAALGVESEQAAQGRYRRKVGTPNATASGIDGTP
ncbi:hypothetical protein [Streptomyces xinghaiensis]|uniref:hypothetical protein n=1 Tax=Streptomyces xinghaiensis TaxID=1038928 RepID=UPI000592B3D4|nr:hypothetical protein [Streptomyces xinghaiensis]MZE80898.1 hypothetical protein [Streptomyces sp. SID5475]